MRVPGPDHPITIERNPNRVVVRLGGRIVADTRRALTLKEASIPPALYVPREDTDMTLLERTDHATHCPYKGNAAYYSVVAGGRTAANAAWTYENPYPAMARIKGHLAFYTNRVEVSEEEVP
jgi:uncharacterized protein (DUF427 family)